MKGRESKILGDNEIWQPEQRRKSVTTRNTATGIGVTSNVGTGGIAGGGALAAVLANAFLTRKAKGVMMSFVPTMTEKYSYDVFGKATITNATGTILTASAQGNRFMFTGREWIKEVGLYDYRNRVYSQELGVKNLFGIVAFLIIVVVRFLRVSIFETVFFSQRCRILLR